MIRASRKAQPQAGLGDIVAVAMADIVGVDPCNERRTAPTESEVAELAEQISEQGLINPLVLRGAAGAWRVLCGSRRWLALQRNGAGIAQARIFEGDDEAAAELSFFENSERCDPHPLDEADAIEHAVAALGAAEVARRRRRPRKWVEQRVALSHLPARARAAWLAGRFGLETAAALTIGDAPSIDELLDSAQADAILSDPRLIRAALKPEGVSSRAGAARFVGEAAYLAAGGRIAARDMFEEAAPDLWLDAPLLLSLARRAQARELDRLCAAEGWGTQLFDLGDAAEAVAPDFLADERRELEFIENAPAPWSDADHARQQEIIGRAALRAVPESDRGNHGVYVGFDSDGRLETIRGVLVGGRSHSQPRVRPPARAETADTAPAGERVPPRPRLPASITASDALLLHHDARRQIEMAASRAVAGVLSGAGFAPRLALNAALAALYGRGRSAVGLTRHLGPGGRYSALARKLAVLDCAEAWAAAAAASDDEAWEAMREAIAGAVDFRRADEPVQAATMARLREALPEQALDARIASYVDYPAFFAAAGRAWSLAALHACLGAEFTGDRTWLKDDDLAADAAQAAKAKTWLPPEYREGAKCD
jgi:ParB/RepB/Spo0J family partition protein